MIQLSTRGGEGLVRVQALEGVLACRRCALPVCRVTCC